MDNKLSVTYLEHSGFVIETANHRLVFDYFQDPAQAMQLSSDKPLYVFVSHSHSDHCNTNIVAWQNKVNAYILSTEIQLIPEFSAIDNAKTFYLKPQQPLAHQQLQVFSYGSTDEGISFLVNVDGWSIFHAGDLNWWHWAEDTPANIKQAQTDFLRELQPLTGKQIDLALFPVDSRLGEHRTKGIDEFVKATTVSHLVAMHSCGQPWLPSQQFLATQPSVWIPSKPGEYRQFIR